MGTGTTGNSNDQNAVSFNRPFGLAVATDDSLFVADYANGLIRKISPSKYP